MNNQLAFALGLALAISSAAFAQDNLAPTPSAATTDQAAATDTQSTDADTHRSHRHHHYRRHADARRQVDVRDGYNPAAERLTGNEPGVAAYQASDFDKYKYYPPVDHGHVHGDPPVIKHDADHAPVPNPPTTTITIPPGG